MAAKCQQRSNGKPRKIPPQWARSEKTMLFCYQAAFFLLAMPTIPRRAEPKRKKAGGRGTALIDGANDGAPTNDASSVLRDAAMDSIPPAPAISPMARENWSPVLTSILSAPWSDTSPSLVYSKKLFAGSCMVSTASSPTGRTQPGSRNQQGSRRRDITPHYPGYPYLGV